MVYSPNETNSEFAATSYRTSPPRQDSVNAASLSSSFSSSEPSHSWTPPENFFFDRLKKASVLNPDGLLIVGDKCVLKHFPWVPNSFTSETEDLVLKHLNTFFDTPVHTTEKRLSQLLTSFTDEVRKSCPSSTQQYFSLLLGGKGLIQLSGPEFWEDIFGYCGTGTGDEVCSSIKNQMFASKDPLTLTLFINELPGDEQSYQRVKDCFKKLAREVGALDQLLTDSSKKTLSLSLTMNDDRKVELKCKMQHPSVGSSFELLTDLAPNKPLLHNFALPNTMYCMQKYTGEACRLISREYKGFASWIGEMDGLIQGKHYANPKQERDSLNKVLAPYNRCLAKAGETVAIHLTKYLQNRSREHAIALTYQISLVLMERLTCQDLQPFLDRMHNFIDRLSDSENIAPDWEFLNRYILQSHSSIEMFDCFLRIIGKTHLCSEDSFLQGNIDVALNTGLPICRFQLGDYMIRCNINGLTGAQEFFYYWGKIPREDQKVVMNGLKAICARFHPKGFPLVESKSAYAESSTVEASIDPEACFELGTKLLEHRNPFMRYMGVLSMVTGHANNGKKDRDHLIYSRLLSFINLTKEFSCSSSFIQAVSPLLPFNKTESVQDFCSWLNNECLDSTEETAVLLEKITCRYMKELLKQSSVTAADFWLKIQGINEYEPSFEQWSLGHDTLNKVLKDKETKHSCELLLSLWSFQSLTPGQMIEAAVQVWQMDNELAYDRLGGVFFDSIDVASDEEDVSQLDQVAMLEMLQKMLAYPHPAYHATNMFLHSLNKNFLQKNLATAQYGASLCKRLVTAPLCEVDQLCQLSEQLFFNSKFTVAFKDTEEIALLVEVLQRLKNGPNTPRKTYVKLLNKLAVLVRKAPTDHSFQLAAPFAEDLMKLQGSLINNGDVIARILSTNEQNFKSKFPQLLDALEQHLSQNQVNEAFVLVELLIRHSQSSDLSTLESMTLRLLEKRSLSVAKKLIDSKEVQDLTIRQPAVWLMNHLNMLQEQLTSDLAERYLVHILNTLKDQDLTEISFSLRNNIFRVLTRNRGTIIKHLSTLRQYVYALDKQGLDLEAYRIICFFWSKVSHEEITGEDRELVRKGLLLECQQETLEEAYQSWKSLTETFDLPVRSEPLKTLVTRVVNGPNELPAELEAEVMIRGRSLLSRSQSGIHKQREKVFSILERLSQKEELSPEDISRFFFLSSTYLLFHSNHWLPLLRKTTTSDLKQGAWSAFMRLNQRNCQFPGNSAAECWKLSISMGTSLGTQEILKQITTLNLDAMKQVFKDPSTHSQAIFVYRKILNSWIIYLKKTKRRAIRPEMIKPIIDLRHTLDNVKHNITVEQHIDENLIYFCTHTSIIETYREALFRLYQILRTSHKTKFEGSFITILQKLKVENLSSEVSGFIHKIATLLLARDAKKVNHFKVAEHLLNLRGVNEQFLAVGGLLLKKSLEQKQVFTGRNRIARKHQRKQKIEDCLHKMIRNQDLMPNITADCLAQNGLRTYLPPKEIDRFWQKLLVQTFQVQIQEKGSKEHCSASFNVLWKYCPSSPDFNKLDTNIFKGVLLCLFKQLGYHHDEEAFFKNYERIARNLRIGVNPRNKKAKNKTTEWYVTFVDMVSFQLYYTPKKWKNIHDNLYKMVTSCIKSKTFTRSQKLEALQGFVMSRPPTQGNDVSFYTRQEALHFKLVNTAAEVGVFKGHTSEYCAYMMLLRYKSLPEQVLSLTKQRRVLTSTIAKLSKSPYSPHHQKAMHLFISSLRYLFDQDKAAITSSYQNALKALEDIPLSVVYKDTFLGFYDYVEAAILPKKVPFIGAGDSNDLEITRELCCMTVTCLMESYSHPVQGTFDESHNSAVERAMQMLMDATDLTVFQNKPELILELIENGKQFAFDVFETVRKPTGLKVIIYLLKHRSLPHLQNAEAKQRANNLIKETQEKIETFQAQSSSHRLVLEN